VRVAPGVESDPMSPDPMQRSEFERLVQAHQAAGYAAARRAAGDQAAALDAVQQVFLRLLEGRLSLAGAVDEQRVLRCAPIREVAMGRRSGRRRTARERRYAMLSDWEHHDVGPETPEQQRLIQTALAELPAPLRSALVLRFHEQLSFAEIGALLSISAASAHERVQRGLERLRGRLGRAGLAGLLVDPRQLWREAAQPPAGLAPRLLALETGVQTAALPALWFAAVAAAGLALGLHFAFRSAEPAGAGPLGLPPETGGMAGAAAASAEDPGQGVPGARRSVPATGTAPAPGSAPVAEAARAPASAELGRLKGRVVDEFGLGLAGVEVRAETSERQGKAALHGDRVLSGPDGGFAFELPVFAPEGSHYALSAATPGGWHSGPSARVRPGATSRAEPLALPASLIQVPGDWVLDLSIVDGGGRAVLGADVRLLASVQGPTGATWLEVRAEGRSDAAGRVELSGAGLGPRLLSIDARAAGLAPRVERLELSRPGRQRLERRLEPGADLHIRLLDPSGAPVGAEHLGSANLPLSIRGLEPDQQYRAESEGLGRFRIPALPPGPWELRFEHPAWSDFQRRIEPGTKELEFVLKPEAQASDAGAHDAEVHGRLFAAGQPVPVEPWTATLLPIPEEHPALADGDFSALLLRPWIGQSMQLELEGDALPARPPEHSFAFDGLAPGRYLLRIGAAGFAPRAIGPFELGEREIRADFDLELSTGATLEARLLDAEGRPLAGGRLLLAGAGALSQKRLADADLELEQSGGRGFLLHSGPASDASGRLRLEHQRVVGALDEALGQAQLQPVPDQLQTPGDPIPVRVDAGHGADREAADARQSEFEAAGGGPARGAEGRLEVQLDHQIPLAGGLLVEAVGQLQAGLAGGPGLADARGDRARQGLGSSAVGAGQGPGRQGGRSAASALEREAQGLGRRRTAAEVRRELQATGTDRGAVAGTVDQEFAGSFRRLHGDAGVQAGALGERADRGGQLAGGRGSSRGQQGEGEESGVHGSREREGGSKRKSAALPSRPPEAKSQPPASPSPGTGVGIPPRAPRLGKTLGARGNAPASCSRCTTPIRSCCRPAGGVRWPGKTAGG
jgi:RNA polymerase sigma factor (sigma-70 family)